MDNHCVIRGCGKVISPQMLMCREHWRIVPVALQRDVWRTWRTYYGWKQGHPDAWEAARQAYRDARTLAIIAVEGCQHVHLITASPKGFEGTILMCLDCMDYQNGYDGTWLKYDEAPEHMRDALDKIVMEHGRC